MNRVGPVGRGRSAEQRAAGRVELSPPISQNGSRPRPVRRTPTPSFARERILAYGKEGAGKSYNWLRIAERYPTVPFYVIDTDDAIQRMLQEEFPELTNVHVEVAQTWEEFEWAADEFLHQIEDWVIQHPISRIEDYPWLVVDFSDTTWSMVQNFFTEQVFDQGIAEYFIMARRKMRGSKKGQMETFEGWTDWQVINKIFQSRWNKLTKHGGSFHLYITAQTNPVAGDRETRSLYQTFKVMPSGEKRMGHRVHTVFYCSNDKSGRYLSTAKDRGRPYQDDLLITDFSVNYLVRIAGWSAE